MTRMPETTRIDLAGVTADSPNMVTIRLDVQGQRRFSFRLWLAAELVVLAARVSPIPMEVELW